MIFLPWICAHFFLRPTAVVCVCPNITGNLHTRHRPPPPPNDPEGKIRGWAFGEGRTVACANVGGEYLAVDGRCPRCGFDLYRGRLLDDADVWGPEPHVACPTCAATYSLRTGRFGPEYRATGLAGFVNTWAKTATIGNASKGALAFVVTREEGTGKVYCRER